MHKERKPSLGFIFTILLLDITGIGLVIPILPQYISHLAGTNISNTSLIGGWLMFSFAIMQFLFSPVLGGLSDKFGRRPVLLFSLLGFFLNYMLIAFAPSIGWLFVGRVLAGICGASVTTATAYIADISTPEKRAQNFGIVGAAFGIGFILGPVMGGLLGHFGFRVPILAAAGVTLINLIYGYFYVPESLAESNRRSFNIRRANPVGSLLQLKKYPFVAAMVGAMFCLYLAGQATHSTWTFFTMEVLGFKELMIGISLGITGLLVAIVQGWLIRIINPAIGLKKAIIAGLLLYAAGFVLIAFTMNATWLFLSLVPLSLGGIAGPAIQGLISNKVKANEQGELQGALTSLMSASSIIGPIVMTGLFSFFTGALAPIYLPGASFILGAILVLISLILVLRSIRKHHTPENNSSTEQINEDEEKREYISEKIAETI